MGDKERLSLLQDRYEASKDDESKSVTSLEKELALIREENACLQLERDNALNLLRDVEGESEGGKALVIAHEKICQLKKELHLSETSLQALKKRNSRLGKRKGRYGASRERVISE